MIRADNLGWICRLVHERTSNQLTPDKEYLVETRLAPLARDAGMPQLDDWIDRLRRDGDQALHDLVAEALTINETSFFRDVSPFTALAAHVLPALIQRRQSQRRLNLWCAACSTGQEPYSLVLLLREQCPELVGWEINVLATDLCKRVLRQAEQGVFSQHEINRGLPARMLVQYFQPFGKDWRISADIRRLVEFREMNLCQNWPALPPMDLILLRNVMIYFGENCRKTVLRRVRENLQPDGYLLLGSSETLVFLDQQFMPVDGCATSLYQVASVTTAAPT